MSEICIQSAPSNSNETYTFMFWAEWAVLGSAKTTYAIQCMGQGISLKSERNNP